MLSQTGGTVTSGASRERTKEDLSESLGGDASGRISTKTETLYEKEVFLRKNSRGGGKRGAPRKEKKIKGYWILNGVGSPFQGKGSRELLSSDAKKGG